MIGPDVSLSAGMVPGQQCVTDPVVRIGDRCLIGKGSGIVGHLSIEIGDDVWTGHHVYITDQNHGYEDVDLPISPPGAARAAGDDRRRVVAGARHGGAARRPHRPPRRGRRRLGRHRRPARLLRRGRRAGPRRPPPRRGRGLEARVLTGRCRPRPVPEPTGLTVAIGRRSAEVGGHDAAGHAVQRREGVHAVGDRATVGLALGEGLVVAGRQLAMWSRRSAR